MKIKITILSIAFLFTFETKAQNKEVANLQMLTRMDSVSYALGFALSGILKNQVGITDSSGLNYHLLNTAMQKNISGDTSFMNETQVRAILGKFQNEQMAKLQAEMQRKDAEMQEKNAPIIAENERLSQAFLEKNKNEKGVITTQSGLQYKILKKGKGKKPKLTDRVKTHYTGKLLDGKVFDSSVERGSPAVFELAAVIPGWTEALQLMPVGSKWELYIPPALAYDKTGNEEIPGGSVLIFEVELLGIEKSQN